MPCYQTKTFYYKKIFDSVLTYDYCTAYLMVSLKLPICVINHHAINMYRGSGGIETFLTSALEGGEWSALTPEEREPPHPPYP
jgi:hypothetical protein